MTPPPPSDVSVRQGQTQMLNSSRGAMARGFQDAPGKTVRLVGGGGGGGVCGGHRIHLFKGGQRAKWRLLSGVC